MVCCEILILVCVYIVSLNIQTNLKLGITAEHFKTLYERVPGEGEGGEGGYEGEEEFGTELCEYSSDDHSASGQKKKKISRR